VARARTSKQKAALRKAQIASARKRRGKGRGRGRKVAAGVGAAAAVGAVAYTAHRLNGKKKRIRASRTDHSTKKRTGRPEGKMKTVYHHTSKENAESIKKHGLKGSRAHDNRAYVSDKPMRGHRYGSHVVKLRVNRHKLRRDVIGNYKTGAKYYSIHDKHLKGTKAVTHKTGKKRARVRSNPYRG
jgi:hypothetical protein